MKKFLILFGIVLLVAGCINNAPSQQITILNTTTIQVNNTLTNNTINTVNSTSASVSNTTPSETLNTKPKIIGPAGCSSSSECSTYCLQHAFECQGWCTVNRDTCEKVGISGMIPAGIPNSPCTADSECVSSLICLDFKCSIPSPDNLARRSGFKLPGNCASMNDCAGYCASPSHTNECRSFCEKFSSFCTNLDSVRAAAAPPECQQCNSCDSKTCITDCTYRCYAYMPVPAPNIDTMKRDYTFERRFQTPIKGVWEAGPAYNRMGVKYFVEDYRAMGVNTYHIIPKYTHSNGKLTHTVDYASEEKALNETIANIIMSKKAGFQTIVVAHDLYDMFPDANPNRSERIRAEEYLDDVEETALLWAKIAEDYKAEYFVPVNEFEYMLYENGYSAQEACSVTNNLYARIIPKVRQIFKGKIYCRVGGMDAKFDCMDFSQCDIFGITYGFSSEDYLTNFETEFRVAQDVAQRDGKSYLMAEAFAFNTRGQEACFNLHEAGMDAYNRVAKNGIGYAFMGLVQNDPINKNSCPLLNTRMVQEYRAFFSRMN